MHPVQCITHISTTGEELSDTAMDSGEFDIQPHLFYSKSYPIPPKMVICLMILTEP